MKIFGAGLAGLIAGCVFPKAKIYERNKLPFVSHQALLRFRNSKVSDITGVKFKEVTVLKSIWSEGREAQPSPRLVAMYSNKVTGKYENRSIIDISTTKRFIAPDDLHNRLIENNRDNIIDDYEISESDYEIDIPIISTLPLSVNAKMLGYEFKTNRNTSSIFVNKFKIEDCDMYATVYYPDSDSSIYRASITKDTLIVESKSAMKSGELWTVKNSLGLLRCNIERILTDHEQIMGKISKVNDDERRVQIYTMSHDHSCYSLGRFALHKNILLDDVAKDIYVIKSMINDDTYGISTRNRI